MADRRILDEITGESFQVAVGHPTAPGRMPLIIRRIRDGASLQGVITPTLGKQLKYSGLAADLSHELRLQYGIFRTRADYCAGYMLIVNGADIQAQLFMTPQILDWLTADPEDEHRKLQELRPSHRYAGTHAANLVNIA